MNRAEKNTMFFSYSIGWLILSLPVFWLSFGKRYPFGTFGAAGEKVGTLFWFCLSVFWVFSFMKWSRESEKLMAYVKRARPFLVLISLCLVPVFDFLSWKHFTFLGYRCPVIAFVLDALAILTGLCFSRKWSGKESHLFWFLASFSVLHLAACIGPFPLRAERSDMMPTIVRAWELFAGGGHAYDASLGATQRLPYPPLLWLSYGPAQALGFDFRWMCVFFRAATIFLLFRRFRFNPHLLVYFGLFLAQPYLLFRQDLCLDFYWFVLVASIIAAERRLELLGGILIGCLVSTIQWGWITAPFLLLLTSQRSHTLKSVGALIRVSVVSVFVCTVVYGGFYLREGDSFVQGMMYWSKNAADPSKFIELSLSFAPLLRKLLGFTCLVWFQRVILIGCGLFALLSPRRILWLAAVSSMIFVLLNPVMSIYYFFGPWLIAGFAAQESSRPSVTV
jgi:hypothetical protein